MNTLILVAVVLVCGIVLGIPLGRYIERKRGIQY